MKKLPPVAKRDEESEGIPVVAPAVQARYQETKGARMTAGVVLRSWSASNRNRCNENRLLRRRLPRASQRLLLLHHQVCLPPRPPTMHHLLRTETGVICRRPRRPRCHLAILMGQGVSRLRVHLLGRKRAGTMRAIVDEDERREPEHVRKDNSMVWNLLDETVSPAITYDTSLFLFLSPCIATLMISCPFSLWCLVPFREFAFFFLILPLHVNLEIRYDVQVPMTRRLGCWFFWKL
jgi:hypothetical protein